MQRLADARETAQAILRALCAHGLDSALESYALARFPHLAP